MRSHEALERRLSQMSDSMRVRRGPVTAVDGTMVTVELDGNPFRLPCLADPVYPGQLGHVLCLPTGGWVVLGATGGGHGHFRSIIDYNQSFASGVNEIVNFSQNYTVCPEVSDILVNNKQAFRLNGSGLWQVECSLRLSPASGGERYLALVDAENHNRRFAQESTFPGAGNAAVSVSTTRRFAYGTALAVLLFQSSGDTIAVLGEPAEESAVALTYLRR